MKYIFDNNGVIQCETGERLVQYTVDANELQVAFTDIDITEYVPYIAFERADGKVSPLIGLAFIQFELNDTKYTGASYPFSDSWVTAVEGILKVAIILKKNNETARTSTFNLNVAKNVDEEKITYIDDVAYNALNVRISYLEKQFEKDYIDKADKDSLGNVIHETYATKTKLDNSEKETKNYVDDKVFELNQQITNNKLENKNYVNGKIDELREYTNANFAEKHQIPTTTSQLTNDSNFITKLVSDLENYYNKTETLELISKIPKFTTEIVGVLPTENIKSQTIYLLPKADGEGNNYYEEYIYIGSRWELIGNTKVNMEGYAKLTDLPTKLSDLQNDSNFLVNEYVVNTNQSELNKGVWKFNELTFPLEVQTITYDIKFTDSLGNSYIGIEIDIMRENMVIVYGKLSEFTSNMLYRNVNNNFTGDSYLAQKDGKLKNDYYLIFEENNTNVLYTIQQYNLLTCYNIISDYATTDFVRKEISNIDFNVTTDYNDLINKPLLNNLMPDETATNNYRGEEAIWMFTNEDWFELPEDFYYPNGSGLMFSFKDSVGNQFDAYQFSFVSGENNLKKIIISGRILGESSFIEIFNSNTKTGLAYDNDNYYITTSPNANTSIITSLPLVAMICFDKPTFNNGESVASEKYVKEEIAKLVGTAPEKLDTIEELAAALKENDNIIETIPTKVSQLENDANYLTSYYIYEETPTKLRNGIWMFRDMPDGYEKGLGGFGIKFRDNLGHTFNYFVGSINVGTTLLEISGRTLDGESILLYKQGISNGVAQTGGLAFNEDGTIKNDYYLVFDEETNSTLLAKILEAGVLEKFDSIYMTTSEAYNAFYDKSTIDGKVEDLREDLREDLLDKAVVDFDILPTEGRAVPNSGYVENIYFNTSLSVTTTRKLLNSVLDEYYNDETEEYKLTADLLVTSDNSIHLQIYDNYDDETDATLKALMIRDIVSGQIYWTDSRKLALQSYGSREYWNPNITSPIPINREVVSTYNGSDVGTYNDLIKNLFSITPYITDKEKGVLGRLDGKLHHYFDDEWIEVGSDNAIIDVEELPENLNNNVFYRVNIEDYEGVEVPRGHDIPYDKIYINKNLNFDKVNDILNEITYSQTYFVVWNNQFSISIRKENGYNFIFYYTDDIGDYLPIFAGEISDTYNNNFIGWNPDFNDVLEIDVSENFVVGTADPQNDKLTEIFSISPFKETHSYKLYHLKNGVKYELVSKDELDNKANKDEIPIKTSQLENDSGFTNNIGTVTSVKVGTTSYNSSNGVVSLPAYPTSLPASDVYSWAKASSKPSYTKSDVGLGNVTNDSQVKRSEMGASNGVATLDSNGKVPTSQLPSYVDDVLEYNAKSNFPTTGETGKIYVAKDTNVVYRWSGSSYVEISSSLALGETSSTAYSGDKGKTNATNIANILNGTTTVPKATTSTKVGSSNVGGTTTPIYLEAGEPKPLNYTIATSVPANAKFTDTDTGATSVTTTGNGNAVTSASYDSSTRKLTLTKGTTFLTSHQSLANYSTLANTIKSLSINGKTITYTKGDNTTGTLTTQDTTYSNATTSKAGLMSTTDKSKLDNTNVSYCTCSTAADVASKIVNLSGNNQWSLKNGSLIMVSFTNTNTASNVTLNVNGTGAYPIWYNNAEYTSDGNAYTGYANRTITYAFNGTHWVWISSSYDANTQSNTNSTDTSSKIFLVGATSQGSNKTTYSHDTVYVDTSGRICGTAGVYSNKYYAPTSSGGTSYGVGANGKVLKSNGSTTYWGDDNNTTYNAATTSANGLMSSTDKSRLDILATSQLLQVKYNPVELTGSAATLSLSVANGFKGLPIAIYSIKESSSENIIRSAIVPLFSNVTCSTGIKSTQGDEICLYYDTSAKTVYERHGEGWNKATSYRRLMVIDLATAI